MDNGRSSVTGQPRTTLRDSFIADSDHHRSNSSPAATTTTTTRHIVPTITHQISLDNSIDSLAGLSLAAVLSGNKQESTQRQNTAAVRTLLDIIKNEETLHTHIDSKDSGKLTWKSFKDRLNIKRVVNSGAKWKSSFPVPRSDIVVRNQNPEVVRMMNNSLSRSLRSNSLRGIDGVPADDMTLREVDGGGEMVGSESMKLSARLEAERQETRRRLSRELVREGDGERQGSKRHNEEDEEEEGEGSGSGGSDDDDEDDDGGLPPGLFGGGGGGGAGMSLMDLLEETDRQAGIDGPTYRFDDDEEGDGEGEEDEEEGEGEGEEEDGGGGGGDGKLEVSCCVCMVRHKGAAFIPCGHTFCRMCSRELWVQRGNCPLCNNFILEVLDIF